MKKIAKKFMDLSVTAKIVTLFVFLVVLSILEGAVAIQSLLSNVSHASVAKLEIVLIIVVTSICVLAGIVFALIIIRSISLPIMRITHKLMEMNNLQGDLTQRIGLVRNDDIGRMASEFDRFLERISTMVKDIVEISQTIKVSSEELSASTSESNKSLEQISGSISAIANGASENVAIVQETDAALKETSNFSETTVETSRQVSADSLRVKDAAQSSSDELDNVISSMEDIKSLSHEITTLIKDLGHSSEKIGNIVQIITAISQQTNLLALNAAIEAARAGESGRGFNVVAEEIRKLANESNEAAKNIVSLVRDNRMKSERAVEFTENAESRISDGSQMVIAVGSHIKSIIGNVDRVATQMQEIDMSISQQAAIIKEVSLAMEAISTTSSDTAAGTDNISSTVQEQLCIMEELENTSVKLADMSEKLNTLTSGFKV